MSYKLFRLSTHDPFFKVPKSNLWFSQHWKARKNQEKSWGLEVSQIFICKKNWKDSLAHQLIRANFIPIFDVLFFCPRFWVTSYWSAACQAFKSCLLIGCQKQVKQLPKIVDQTWVAHFNLFKHLNDLQLPRKLFESIYLVPSTS